jgi:hypothetical protein
MAVRDDFAPGEVLAAADLNDTFASKLPYSYGTATPSTTDSGFLWYDSNSTPPVTKYWNGSSFANLVTQPGLELITAETFSAVSSVSVNGCFTSSYANYRILISGTASTGVSSSIRLRASGTDDTGSNYINGRYYVGAAQSQAAGSTNNATTTSWPVLVYNGSSIVCAASVDVFSPQKTTQSAAHCQTSGAFLDLYGLSHNQGTAYDGFTIITNTGTITGTVRVYGYKD